MLSIIGIATDITQLMLTKTLTELFFNPVVICCAQASLPGLTKSESFHLSRGLSRLSRLCLECRFGGLRILVDAEYTYLNPGISAVTLAMMSRFNRGRTALVGNTYQCYLTVVGLTNYLINLALLPA